MAGGQECAPRTGPGHALPCTGTVMTVGHRRPLRPSPVPSATPPGRGHPSAEPVAGLAAHDRPAALVASTDAAPNHMV